jgi:DNA-binding Lrp family transcriptional regulator
MIDPLDLRLLKIAQNGIKLTEQPYLYLGKELGISEEEVMIRLDNLSKQGVIRRFAATIGHRSLGIMANAMIIWKVSPHNVEQAGKIFASSPDVTHCYERETAPSWPYNIYTMVHSRNREDCLKIVKELSRAADIKEYKIFFSEREYKKTSARI